MGCRVVHRGGRSGEVELNAPALARPLTIRFADLGDPIDRARVGAYVHEHRDGTPLDMLLMGVEGVLIHSHTLYSHGLRGILIYREDWAQQTKRNNILNIIES